ncbi:MAG: hypothetical protein HY882_12900 [Deltaproteobacteria bacterium]|nr:hypothetical protein [Deltaproteobacteria bacterium]
MNVIKYDKSLPIALFLLILILPASLMAQKEEAPSPVEKKPRATYYDFEDILVPSELSLDKKNSFVYGTDRSKVGLLILEGRVEPSSLASFFQSNMQKDGWRLLSSFKYREYLLNFLKEDRACVITITEKAFTTTVEIRVGPIEQGSLPIKGMPSR